MGTGVAVIGRGLEPPWRLRRRGAGEAVGRVVRGGGRGITLWESLVAPETVPLVHVSVRSSHSHEEAVASEVRRGDEGSIPRVTDAALLWLPPLRPHEGEGEDAGAEVATVIERVLLPLVQTPSLTVTVVGEETVGTPRLLPPPLRM